MRMMLKACMDTDAGNQLIQDGSLQTVLRSVAEELNPEASYFFADQGKRTALFVFDMKDTSQIPVIAETLFTRLRAEVEFQPVMNLEEVARGLESWQKGRHKKAA